MRRPPTPRLRWAVGVGAALSLAERVPAQADPVSPVVAYTIEARLDTSARQLVGREIIDYRNPSSGDLTSLYLHLYANAFRDRHTRFARDRVRLAWIQDPSDVTPSGRRRGFITIREVIVGGEPARFTVDETVMAIPLARPLRPDEGLRVEVTFELAIPEALQRLGVVGTNYAFGLWFPKLAVVDGAGWHADPHRPFGEFYADYGLYDVTLTVPSGFVVGATGELVRAIANGDGTTTQQWRAEHVRDFTWVADPRYRTKEVVWGGVRVEYLYLGNERGLAQGMAAAVQALEFYRTRFGPYAYGHLVIAESKALGRVDGMEYSQLVMIGAELRRAADISVRYEEVLVHELAHQWWPGMVGSNELDEAWLDEGFATFATRAFLEQRYGRDVALFRWPGILKFLPTVGERTYHRSEYASAASRGFDSRVVQPAPAFADFMTYQTAVYSKASFVLEMLEYLLGPAQFTEVMRAYGERFRYRNARTADFIGVAEAVSGRDLRWFFDQWLSTTKTCDYSIESMEVSAAAGNRYRSLIRLRRRGEIVMPVELRLTLESGEVLERVWDGRATTDEVVVESASRIRRAVLDPDAHLLETDRFNNHQPRGLKTSLVPAFVHDDAYELGHVPLLWYDHGVEVGLLLVGGHGARFVPPAWVEQKHMLGFRTVYNFGSRSARASLSYSNPVGFLGARAGWGFRVARDDDRETAEARLRWLLGPRFYRGPYHTLRLVVAHDRWRDSAGVRPRVDLGTVNTVRAGYTLSALLTDYYPIQGALVEVETEGSWHALGSDWEFFRGAGRVELYQPVAGGIKVAMNLLAGGVLAGAAPRQKQLGLTREGNFRAAEFEGELGDALTAVNAELRVVLARRLSLGAALFAGAARAWDSGAGARGGTNYELGLGIRMFDNAPYALQVDWPVWAQGRLVGGKRWDPGRLTFRVGRPFRGAGS